MHNQILNLLLMILPSTCIMNPKSILLFLNKPLCILPFSNAWIPSPYFLFSLQCPL